MDLFDYLQSEGKKSFRDLPMNELDSLCLSLFSYLPLKGYAEEGFSVSHSVESLVGLYLIYQEECEARFARVIASKHTRFFRLMAKSPRFSSLRITGFVSKTDREREMQFCALTILLEEGIFVSFGGTDGTILGWKEDFNMSFLDAVPAQLAAQEYLDEAARRFPQGKVILGGHSKGGNLALFAAARCQSETRLRLASIHLYDAPGFNAAFLASPGYQTVHALVRSYIPQTSVVGRLLEEAHEPRVVHSVSRGLLQHDPYTWSVEGTSFVYEKETDRKSRYVDRTLSAFLGRVDPKTRERFVDLVYELISATEVENVNELTRAFVMCAPRILERAGDFSEEERRLLFETAELFFSAAFRQLQPGLGRKSEWSARLLEAYEPVRESLSSITRSVFSREKEKPKKLPGAKRTKRK